MNDSVREIQFFLSLTVYFFLPSFFPSLVSFSPQDFSPCLFFFSLVQLIHLETELKSSIIKKYSIQMPDESPSKRKIDSDELTSVQLKRTKSIAHDDLRQSIVKEITKLLKNEF